MSAFTEGFGVLGKQKATADPSLAYPIFHPSEQVRRGPRFTMGPQGARFGMTSRSYSLISGSLASQGIRDALPVNVGISFASDCVTALEMLDIMDIWDIR